MKSASEFPEEVMLSRLITQHGETKKAEDICEGVVCSLFEGGPDIKAMV